MGYFFDSLGLFTQDFITGKKLKARGPRGRSPTWDSQFVFRTCLRRSFNCEKYINLTDIFLTRFEMYSTTSKLEMSLSYTCYTFR